jgi:hypothetical protein
VLFFPPRVVGELVLGRLLTQKEHRSWQNRTAWLKGAVFLFTIIILNFDELLTSANALEARRANKPHHREKDCGSFWCFVSRTFPVLATWRCFPGQLFRQLGRLYLSHLLSSKSTMLRQGPCVARRQERCWEGGDNSSFMQVWEACRHKMHQDSPCAWKCIITAKRVWFPLTSVVFMALGMNGRRVGNVPGCQCPRESDSGSSVFPELH